MSVSSRYSNGSANRNGSSTLDEATTGPFLKRNSAVKRQNPLKRHSLSMGDNYVQLVGKFETNAAQQQSSPDGGIQSATRLPAETTRFPDTMGDGSPVVAELRTNVIINDEFSLLTDLSQHLAAQYTKPSTSIMISLQHSTCLTLGGMSDPCYLLNITAVPSTTFPVDHRRVSQQVQSFLADVLGVAVGRGVILFHPMLAQNVAFQPVQEPEKMPEISKTTHTVQSAQLADARRRSGDASWLSLPADIVNESTSDDDRPLRDTLAALQGDRAGSIKSIASERQERRKTLHAPPSLPPLPSSVTSGNSSQRQERRKTLQVPPRQPVPSPSASTDNVSWTQLQERRRSLQMPPTLPTIPSPSMMPSDFGLASIGTDDDRPSTSRGRSANDNKPRLDDQSKSQSTSASNGKPARPKSIAAESWSYERQNREMRARYGGGENAQQRPKSSGAERGRPVDWRVSQLLSPPTLHPNGRPTSNRSNSGSSQSSQKKPRPLSLPSAAFLSGLKSPPQSPRSPPAEQQRYSNHNFDNVVIPPVPRTNSGPQRPNDRMRKRRSFVTALPQVESIPEVPPVPKMPDVVAVENPVPAVVEEAPLKKRKSLFKLPFKRSSKQG